MGIGSVVYAANTFSYSFVSNVIGKTEFKLKNKKTVCKSRAATYKYHTKSYANYIGNYRITLDGNGFFNPNYIGDYKKADDKMHDTNYKKIQKNTYTVNIGTKDDLVARCLQITGTGKLLQE